jgi:hypothetical protein
MARKYEFRSGVYGWAAEACEEEVFIDAYDEIRAFVTPGQTWKVDFEHHFFDRGQGISVSFLDLINGVRKRRALQLVELRETEVYDYGRSPDRLNKAKQRRRVWMELIGAGPSERSRRIDTARAEMAILPPPHFSFEEYKARNQKMSVAPTLDFHEIARRVDALREASRRVPNTRIDASLIAKIFALANSELHAELTSKLSPVEAVDVAEQITDPKLRHALMKHIVSTM